MMRSDEEQTDRKDTDAIKWACSSFVVNFAGLYLAYILWYEYLEFFMTFKMDSILTSWAQSRSNANVFNTAARWSLPPATNKLKRLLTEHND